MVIIFKQLIPVYITCHHILFFAIMQKLVVQENMGSIVTDCVHATIMVPVIHVMDVSALQVGKVMTACKVTNLI